MRNKKGQFLKGFPHNKGIKRSAAFSEMRRKMQTGKKLSIETRKKMSLAAKGRFRSLEYRENIRKAKLGPKNGMFGKTVSDRVKALISLRLKGVKRGPMSDETKKKVSLAKMGKPGPWLGKKRLNFSGANTPMWKGGITPKNVRIRTSPRYVSWRKKVFVRDRYTCQDCLMRGVYLQAHHLKAFAKFPRLRFSISNGITLCVVCHKIRHAKKRS